MAEVKLERHVPTSRFMMLTPRARNTAIAAAIAFKLGYIGLAAIFGFAFGLCSRVRF